MTFPDPYIKVVSGVDGVIALGAWIGAMPGTHVLLGLDVETTGLDVFADGFAIRTVQLAHGGQAWVLRVTEVRVAQMMNTLLSNPRLRFVAHGQYDSVALRKAWGVDLSGRLMDTYLLARLVHPSDTEDHGLKALSRKYLGTEALIESEKRLHGRFKELALQQGERDLLRGYKKLLAWGFANCPTYDPVFTRYAALDAHACLLLAPALVKVLGTGRNLVAMEMRLADAATRMRVRGNLVDVGRVRTLLDRADDEIDGCEDTIETLTGGVAARSPRLGDWLVAEGVVFHEDEMTPGGRPSLAAGVIDAVTEREERRDPEGHALKVLQARRSMMKHTNDKAILEQYIDRADDDWRVHPDTKTLRARTSRMSITGPALQTLKKTGELRACLLADAGMSLVSVDFSQIEVRVAAALSGDPNLTAPLVAGGDLHSDTARRIFGEGFDDRQRKLAKMTNFAALYGGGAKTIAVQAGIPVLEARAVVNKWRQAYPLVVALGTSLAARYEITTPTGRVIPTDPDRDYASLNFMIQSTARDLLVIAVMRVIDMGLGDALWLLVHDEMILQVPADDAEEVAGRVVREMEFDLYGVPVTAQAEVLGGRWGS